MRRIARWLIVPGLLVSVHCTENMGPADQDNIHAPLSGLIVSGPVIGAGSSSNATDPSVTYLSLVPGTLPLASLVEIRNLTRGSAPIQITLFDGGFDPVAIEASADDELEVVVHQANGMAGKFAVKVPPRRPPSVVRTNPPKGRTDVALSTRPGIVFSEPLDPRSLSAGSIQLLRNGIPVSGTLALEVESGWSVEFTPTSLLEPGTTYELIVTRDVRDLGGDPVAEPISATFTTTTTAGPSGSLVVSNATTGGAFDPDGFTVTIDGARPALMELNDELTLGIVAAGPHTVVLSGISSNCAVNGGPSRDVVAANGSATRLEFLVSCTPTPDLASIRIVFARASGGVGFRAGSAIVAMNADGSGRVQLTSGSFNDYGPDVSPDGRKIAFMRDPLTAPFYDSEIHTMNADGTGAVRIADSFSYDPDWSPDGRRIVFSRGSGHWGGPIQVMQADGSGATALTGPNPFPEDAWPAWSPDGNRIAFTRAEITNGTATSIWSMAADGKSAVRLSESRLYGGSSPVWAPDGSLIAFSDAVGAYPALTSRIRVMNADGSDEWTLMESASQLIVWDWSADGQLLLLTKRFSSGTTPRSDVFLLSLADRTIVRVTADRAYNETPTFGRVAQ